MFVMLLCLFTLGSLASCTDNSRKLYCSNCGKNVEISMSFHGYKYQNEYGYQVKLWDCYCKECGKYLGVYSGVN